MSPAGAHPSVASLAGPDTDAVPLARLRVWLRLLRVTREVGGELRERLRETGDLTLPQFDVLAALARADGGLTMTALSNTLLVSPGNVTGLVSRLQERGLVLRVTQPSDRRSAIVRLSAEGRVTFDAVSTEHRRWISRALAGIGPDQCEDLLALLDAARRGGPTRGRAAS